MLLLERLSPGERAVFVLKDGFDLTFVEIGEMIDEKPATCRQRYRRAARSGPQRAAENATRIRPIDCLVTDLPSEA